MYVGEVSKAQLISVALMIMFALAAMFLIGYKFAYDKAIRYANEQIEEISEKNRINGGLGINPDFTLGNIEPIDYEIKNG